MNIERTARRRLFGRQQKAFVYPAPGCIETLSEELGELLGDLRSPAESPPVVKRLREAVVLERASYRSLLEVAMRLTTAQEMTLVVAEGPVHNRGGLEALLGGVAWELFFAPSTDVGVRVESFDSSLYHEGLITECVAASLERVGAKSGPASSASPQRIRVHFSRNLCRVELSLAGDPLWKRGYRGTLTAVAPFREDLAQSAIRTALRDAGLERTPPHRLLVPFAGSGTFLFEYLITVLRMPPFLFRESYAFEHFTAESPPSVDWVRRRLSEELADRLRAAVSAPILTVLVEKSLKAADSVRDNLARFRSLLQPILPDPDAPFGVELQHADLFSRRWRSWLGSSDVDGGGGRVHGEEVSEAARSEKTGLFLPLNPPYGKRLPTRSTDQLYGQIGRSCGELASTVHPVAGFVLCPSESSWGSFLEGAGRLSERTRHVSHGGIDLRVCSFWG